MHTRRERTLALPTASPADPALQPALDAAKRHASDASTAEACDALATLADLTSWEGRNQLGLVDANGLCTLFELLRRCAARNNTPTADPTSAAAPNETAKLVLWVLLNLAANDAIGPRIAAEPGCVRDLVSLLEPDAGSGGGAPAATGGGPPVVAVFAARCLVNLMRCGADAQDAALKAGALKAASKLLLRERDDGAAKAFVWLLCALTASHLSPARAAIAASPELVQRLLHMLDCSRPSAVPGAVLAARALGNIARGGPDCQAALARAGAAQQLLACLAATTAASDVDQQLTSAALEALAALAADHRGSAAAILSDPRLIPKLEFILLRSGDTRQPEQAGWCKAATGITSSASNALLAAHVLVHVLAYGTATTPFSAGMHGSSSSSVNGVANGAAHSAPAGPPPALYLSLEDAARQIGVRLQRTAAQESGSLGMGAGAAMRELHSNGNGNGHGSIGGGADGSEEDDVLRLLPAVEAAELLHTVHDVLLPRMREPNTRAATDAVAQLHALAAAAAAAAAAGGDGGGASAACLQAMAEAGLVQQVVRLLAGRDAQLSTACLCLLDRLSGSAACRALLADAGWLDAVETLLDSPDGVVRLLARRALCSMHAAEWR